MASLLRRMARGGIDSGQTGIVRPSSDPRGHTVDLHQWLAFPDVYFAEMSFAENKRAAIESRLEEARPRIVEQIFLLAMSAIGLIVLGVSRSVAIFLVDAGLLFEEFFRRMSRLAIPAFAFLTFYALLVILFASIFSIVSQFSTGDHFRVGSVTRGLSFNEAMHFSIVTISTVGYGDIVPVSNIARVLTSIEVICGVLLLLFGVSELLGYTREHRADRPDKENDSQ